MIETVSKKTFYHINRTTHSSPYPLLEVGQTISSANAPNPFFQFFDNRVRSYPVTLQDQTIIQVPAIKFLNSVRDGIINASNLAAIAAEVATHFMLLSREMLFENVRLTKFPLAPSRCTSFWFIATPEELEYWQNRLLKQETGSTSQFLEVNASGTILRCDASHLFGDSERFSESVTKAERYWSGTYSETGAEPEILFDGEFTVTSILQKK